MEAVNYARLGITPDKWGLLIYLSENWESLNRAKELKDANPTDRLIINRAYYCMYHAARASVIFVTKNFI
ncbi:MAG TPA: hypothetical protein EYP22_05580 [Methanosarcinales archaeon]|nr:hypothetical protein [Methanosarcinales archaeon]